MTGTSRRDAIIQYIEGSDFPISGQKLASEFGVSRQVIVQDVALIRAAGYDIISTNRGYVLNTPIKTETVQRVFKVYHTDEQIEDELCSIVDQGGFVENAMINHRVYGHLEVPLNIKSRRNVNEFLHEIQSGKSSPLMKITSNYHYHTVCADSEETLDMIENLLREKQILVEDSE